MKREEITLENVKLNFLKTGKFVKSEITVFKTIFYKRKRSPLVMFKRRNGGDNTGTFIIFLFEELPWVSPVFRTLRLCRRCKFLIPVGEPDPACHIARSRNGREVSDSDLEVMHTDSSG